MPNEGNPEQASATQLSQFPGNAQREAAAVPMLGPVVAWLGRDLSAYLRATVTPPEEST